MNVVSRTSALFVSAIRVPASTSTSKPVKCYSRARTAHRSGVLTLALRLLSSASTFDNGSHIRSVTRSKVAFPTLSVALRLDCRNRLMMPALAPS